MLSFASFGICFRVSRIHVLPTTITTSCGLFLHFPFRAQSSRQSEVDMGYASTLKQTSGHQFHSCSAWKSLRDKLLKLKSSLMHGRRYEDLENRLVEAIKKRAATRQKSLKSINSIIMKFPQFKEELKDVKHLFDQYDKDSMGTIKYGELNQCLADLKIGLTEKDTYNLYHYCDMDGNKGIQFNEFIVLLCLASLLMEPTSASDNMRLPGSPELEATINRLVEAFVVLDKDGDGKLRRRDMTTALNDASGKERSPSRITRRRFREMDWNKDGRVNFKEFLLSMTKWIGIDVDEERKPMQ